MLRKAPFKSSYLFLVFTFCLFLVTQCFRDSHSSHLLVGEENVAVFDSCRDNTFSWGGRFLTVGKVLASSNKGNSIYELQTYGSVVHDMVLKSLTDPSYQNVKFYMDEEIQIAIDMPAFYTRTEPLRIYKLPQRDGQQIFAGLLVKQRVNGPTLGNLAFGISGSPPFQLGDLKEAVRALIQFRSNLAQELKRLSDQNIFIWDLHGYNIMYDRFEKKWLIVDANRDEGFDVFLDQISKASAGHIDLEVYQHFLKRWQSEQHDLKFFKDYIDIYLGKEMNRLQILSGIIIPKH